MQKCRYLHRAHPPSMPVCNSSRKCRTPLHQYGLSFARDTLMHADVFDDCGNITTAFGYLPKANFEGTFLNRSGKSSALYQRHSVASLLNRAISSDPSSPKPNPHLATTCRGHSTRSCDSAGRLLPPLFQPAPRRCG